MTNTRWAIAATVVSTLMFGSAHARPYAMEVWTRWSDAKRVRYHIVGVYEAPTEIAFKHTTGLADVTDRVVIDLDWDRKAHTIIGTPRVQNTKSVTKNPRNPDPKCPAPVISGEYEHPDATEVKPSERERVELVGTTSFPQADVTDCQGSRVTTAVAAILAPALVYVPLPDPAALGMPIGTTAMFVVSADRKSFVVKLEGWSWTYTPSMIP